MVRVRFSCLDGSKEWDIEKMLSRANQVSNHHGLSFETPTVFIFAVMCGYSACIQSQSLEIAICDDYIGGNSHFYRGF